MASSSSMLIDMLAVFGGGVVWQREQSADDWWDMSLTRADRFKIDYKLVMQRRASSSGACSNVRGPDWVVVR